MNNWKTWGIIGAVTLFFGGMLVGEMNAERIRPKRQSTWAWIKSWFVKDPNAKPISPEKK